MSGRKDISGQTINKWRVINYSHTKGKIAYYNCICLGCMKEFKVDGRNIRSGRSKSCVSCARKKAVSERGPRKSPQISSFRKLYASYKKNAKRRNIFFDMSFEKFHKLAKSNCHYCGIEPSTTVNPVSYRPKCTGEEYFITYNGIDRVDNNKGYSEDNIVSCCSHCNKAKHVLSVSEFKEWVNRVAEHMGIAE